MLVERILPLAKKRLVTVRVEQPLRVAADLLCRADTGVVAVCDSENRLVGVVTKTDIVRQMGHCCGESCKEATSFAMERDVICCAIDSDLENIFSIMKERGLTNVPIVDAQMHPLGILNALDVLEILLGETEREDALLRDYVACTGYH